MCRSLLKRMHFNKTDYRLSRGASPGMLSPPTVGGSVHRLRRSSANSHGEAGASRPRDACSLDGSFETRSSGGTYVATLRVSHRVLLRSDMGGHQPLLPLVWELASSWSRWCRALGNGCEICALYSARPSSTYLISIKNAVLNTEGTFGRAKSTRFSPFL